MYEISIYFVKFPLSVYKLCIKLDLTRTSVYQLNTHLKNKADYPSKHISNNNATTG